MKMDVHKTLYCFYTTTKIYHESKRSFAYVLKSFSSGVVGYTSLPQRCTLGQLLQLLLNWRINVVIIVNYQKLRLRRSHLSVLVEQNSLLKSFIRIVFYNSAIRNAFAFHKLLNIHFCEHFLQISHDLKEQSLLRPTSAVKNQEDRHSQNRFTVP